MLAARIQELFGLADTPRVAGGRVKVLLHLLAPNYRPQQVTDDLASFWANTYPLVRKELRGRYPKHAWPDDPTTAPAVRRRPTCADRDELCAMLTALREHASRPAGSVAVGWVESSRPTDSRDGSDISNASIARRGDFGDASGESVGLEDSTHPTATERA